MLLREVLVLASFKPYIQIFLLALAAFGVSEMIREKTVSSCFWFS